MGPLRCCVDHGGRRGGEWMACLSFVNHWIATGGGFDYTCCLSQSYFSCRRRPPTTLWFDLKPSLMQFAPNIMEVVNVSTSLGCFHGSIKGSSSTACGRVSVGWPDLSNQNLKDYHSGLRKTPCVFCHYLKGTILLWFSVENRWEYRFPCGLTVWPVTFSSRFFLPWCQPFPEPYRQLQVSAVVAEKPSLARCLSRQVDADP